MKALVTGGAGFIGSSVVKLGLEKGWSIVVLDNFSTGYRENLPESPMLQVIEGDIRRKKDVDMALKGVNAVFHLAASVGNARSIENPFEDSDVNVKGSIQLLEGMRRAGVPRIVYSSSAAIFGEPGYLPIDEKHMTEPDSPYGVSKLACEKLCLCYGRLYGWQVVALRYFNVYGINQRFDAYGNVIPIFVNRLLADTPLIIYGDGGQTRDFVNVEDIVRANWMALESNMTGIFNIGSGTATTIKALAEMIFAVTGKCVDLEYHDHRPGEVRHSRACIKQAGTSFGYAPTISLKHGLLSYIEWMRKAYVIFSSRCKA